jgi:hypothetical protein
VIQAASDPMHRDQALTPPPGVNSVISLHQLVDYVNTMHPEHVESFHRLHKSIKPQPQNDIRKSIQHMPLLIKSRKLHRQHRLQRSADQHRDWPQQVQGMA